MTTYSTDAKSPSISSRVRSNSADFATTWSKPAACARPRRVRVIGEAEQRHVRVRVGDVVGVDARDVRDDDIGWVDPVARLEAVLRKQRLEFSSEEQLDPNEQDRGHAWPRR